MQNTEYNAVLTFCSRMPACVPTQKVDGCGPGSYYEHGYAAMGKALENSGRDIVYSCSWPAYIGSDETKKPFQTFIDDGCNLWRNYAGECQSA